MLLAQRSYDTLLCGPLRSSETSSEQVLRFYKHMRNTEYSLDSEYFVTSPRFSVCSAVLNKIHSVLNSPVTFIIIIKITITFVIGIKVIVIFVTVPPLPFPL